MTSRRKVLVGLGAVVAGGGAALGSGAFSQTTAAREFEVNVVTDEQIAEDFVDVILNDVDGTDTVGVGENGEDDPAGMFPNGSDVSLMQNDVRIVFGPSGNELPPNSNVTYDGLITIVNEEGDEPQDFEVSFSIDVDQGDSSLTFDPSSTSVVSDNTEDVTVTVDTGSDDQTEGTLTIEISEA